MSQLPPGFVLDTAPPAARPVNNDPIVKAREPEKPEKPDTTWRILTPEEAAAEGLPPGRVYQKSSTGSVSPIGDKIGGKPFSDGAAQRIEKGVGTFSALAGSLGSFQDEFAGNAITGGLENTIQGKFSSFGTPGQRDWWAAFQQNDNIIRNELFGATLTPSEQTSYLNTTVDPSLDPKIVRENLKRRAEILGKALDRQKRFMVANGYDPEAVEILYEPLKQMEALAGTAPQSEKNDNQPPPPALMQGAAPGDG